MPVSNRQGIERSQYLAARGVEHVVCPEYYELGGYAARAQGS